MKGEAKLPADKSISHRAALLGAIAEGVTRIENFSDAADCHSTLECLAQLGVGITREGGEISIEGRGRRGLRPPQTPLDCGNSGTTMRLLAGILAGQPFDSVLVGDSSLMRRPMGRIIEPLTRMGAEIESDEGRPPLRIRGRSDLNAIDLKTEKPSAQVKSCVLLAGLFAEGNTSVTESVATRDHTERMLEHMGAEIAVDETDGHRVAISGNSVLRGSSITVPADISAATFFLVGAACLSGSEISFPGVGVNPTRNAVIDMIRRCGVEITLTNERVVNNEPVADIVASSTGVGDETLVIEGSEAARLIDELPALAVLGTRLQMGIVVRDAADLRVKESDRIAAIVAGLRAMGADAEEMADGFRVGHSRLEGARVDSADDHRIAMALAVAGLLAEGETEIVGAECVDISFPDFFEVLDGLAVW